MDFKQTIIIMTSNAGAQMIMEPKHLGFMSGDTEKRDYERMKSGVMEEVRRMFKPEFLNRIDEKIVFKPLEAKQLRKIVTLLTRKLVKRLAEKDITLRLSPAALDQLAKDGYNPEMGARPLRRTIQDEVEDELAQDLVSEKLQAGDTVKIGARGGKLRFEIVKAKTGEKIKG